MNFDLSWCRGTLFNNVMFPGQLKPSTFMLNTEIMWTILLHPFPLTPYLSDVCLMLSWGRHMECYGNLTTGSIPLFLDDNLLIIPPIKLVSFSTAKTKDLHVVVDDFVSVKWPWRGMNPPIVLYWYCHGTKNGITLVVDLELFIPEMNLYIYQNICVDYGKEGIVDS